MTPLTDAQLAAILTDEQLRETEDLAPVSDGLRWKPILQIVASHRVLAARLAEAEQTIAQRAATIHGLSTIIDGHEAEVEDLSQRCDKATAQLAAAQATIERLRTAMETIRDVGMDEQGITRTTTVASAWECERVARAALAPSAPEADDAR